MSKPLLNSRPKVPDLPIIFEELIREGYSLQDIADYSGVKSDSLAKIKSEVVDVPKNWYILYLILDLYLRNLGLPVPMYGDHN